MPYIEKEVVAEIRKDIKATFPDFKFSIVRDHYSSINLAVLSGPIDFGNDNFSVNKYRISDDFEGEAKTFLQLLADYLGKDQETEVEDGDYGRVPNYYYNIRIGQWYRPYQIKK